MFVCVYIQNLYVRFEVHSEGDDPIYILYYFTGEN